MSNYSDDYETKGDRRERKRNKELSKMPKHNLLGPKLKQEVQKKRDEETIRRLKSSEDA